jgi:phosphate transport system protein
MPTEHLAKTFEEELKRLNSLIARMGGLAETQIADAIQAVGERDSDLAAEVVANDVKIDELEREVDDLALKILALRQPLAVDLRRILSTLKIAADLERIGDYATNVAKRAIALNQVAPVRPVHSIPRMGRVVKQMIKDVLDAYATNDVEKAVRVWNRDEEVDEMYSSLFRVLLTYMMEDPRSITASTHLLFIAKNIERIGDHSTNIAETIHFLVNGVPLAEMRPKHDNTSFEVVRPNGPNGGS